MKISVFFSQVLNFVDFYFLSPILMIDIFFSFIKKKSLKIASVGGNYFSHLK